MQRIKLVNPSPQITHFYKMEKWIKSGIVKLDGDTLEVPDFLVEEVLDVLAILWEAGLIDDFIPPRSKVIELPGK